ncbi:hypothetical protein M8C21_015872 [Ambrosia artemisiifolia]|uniref:Uncharacterized protein n=1 Tax=Ambrosia artemisiifolia TaxID=4212 RepID=A0AAD5D1Q3_AMBAR|nr:hypothetical protein M8C21_015872 [Ambrosia artemisiifolia]
MNAAETLIKYVGCSWFTTSKQQHHVDDDNSPKPQFPIGGGHSGILCGKNILYHIHVAVHFVPALVEMVH